MGGQTGRCVCGGSLIFLPTTGSCSFLTRTLFLFCMTLFPEKFPHPKKFPYLHECLVLFCNLFFLASSKRFCHRFNFSSSNPFVFVFTISGVHMLNYYFTIYYIHGK